MDLSKVTDQVRLNKVLASKRVRAAERIIAPRTDFNYRFEDTGTKVHVWGYTPDGDKTSVAVIVE